MRKRKPRRKIRPVGPPAKKARRNGLQGRGRTSDLARLRIRKGLSIADVARRTHLSFVTIWRIEEGKQKPTRKTKDRIRRAVQHT